MVALAGAEMVVGRRVSDVLATADGTSIHQGTRVHRTDCSSTHDYSSIEHGYLVGAPCSSGTSRRGRGG